MVAHEELLLSAPAPLFLHKLGYLMDAVPQHTGGMRFAKKRYPKIQVGEDKIFIIDGSIWTSAGMGASIDLALAMIEKDLGVDIVRLVAKQFVDYHRRLGGQSQFSGYQWKRKPIEFNRHLFMPVKTLNQRFLWKS